MTSVKTKSLSIAIDGPAGAGKSTTARLLAAGLGFVYVDSGAMYRAVAFKCREEGVSEDNDTAVAGIAESLQISFEPSKEALGDQKVFADGADVSREIRDPAISQLASTVSAIPRVRELLVAKQRALGEAGGVVMEGRDIGTVVLPEAEVKIFLTASLDERARRRFLELEHKGAGGVMFEQVRSDMAERDNRDSTRAVSPLMPADDSVVIDSEDMTARQVVEAILDICSAKSGE